MPRKKERLLTILLISPSVVAIAVFVYGFIGWTARVSVSRWRGLRPDFTFVGLENFTRIFESQRFHVNMWNITIFTVLFIVGCLALGLLLAILLDQRARGEGIFRSIYLFPMAISFIVTGVVWRWLLNPATAIERLTGLNLLLHEAGLGFLVNVWHMHPQFGMAAIALAGVWQMSGFTMALYLAGMRSIPDSLVEAACVDGASKVQIYRRIIIPLLRPVTLSAVVILGHISLKLFDLVMAISAEGGKGFSVDVPAMNMWFTTFRAMRFGQGAAIAMVILLLVSVLAVPYLIYSMRKEAQL
ncbi:TPA: sugar ABC transporter permease [Candidatus Acetothermia bacterium]|nr:sugar ABC transporter permease [Candidatus Acetothermia bacterium]